jgi:dipeptidyl aminopeptidase/acylaminoacyl peptidase
MMAGNATLRLAGLLGLLWTAATPAFAQTAPLEVYGGLPAYDLVEVSPAGDRLAYIAVIGEERSLIIHDLNDMSLIGGVRAGEVKVRDLNWAGEGHVVLSTSATQAGASLGLGLSELFDGKIYSIATRSVVDALRHTEGVLLGSKLAGATITRTVDGRGMLFVSGYTLRYPALYSINLDTGVGRQIEDPAPAGGYMINGRGEPVVRVQYDGQVFAIQARRGGFWRTAWRTDAPIDTPDLISLGRTDREVVVMGAPDGRPDGYHLLDLETGTWSDLPFEGSVKSVWTHPQTRLLIGARTGEDGDVGYQFLDPAAERSWRSVRAAFRDRRVQLRSWSDDMRQLVVFTEGPGDPGTYQLVDLDRRTAEIIGETYPLTPEQVGEVRPVSYPAADGMTIPGYLTLPPGVTEPRGLPLVVLPHGGPASRDYLGFDWWAQGLASRGYAVLQPNFRGSDGLGRAHLEAGYGEWGRKMQTDLSDGVRWLAEQGIVDASRVCIVGASYGGYAALAGPTLDPGIYRCAVSVAGVSDLRRMVQWSAEQSGRRDSPSVRYWNRFMGAERLGDRALDETSPAAQAARADAPILLLHGRDDTVVPFEQSRIMADALARAGKPHELIELSGEDHWLSRAETRRRMLAETVRFLEAHNPPR